MAPKKQLIDAEELINILEEYATGVYYADIFSFTALKRIIEEHPTVDAVEVVHGRWIAVPSSDMMTGKAYKCSECGKMRYGSFMPNYCQICGAKMDGKVGAVE